VLGLSGGIDSSFLAAVLWWRRIPYQGFCLPLVTNAPEEVARAKAVAQAYAWPPRPLEEMVVDFSDQYRALSAAFTQRLGRTTPLAEGNLKARLRMLFLYHVAQLSGGCVLSTDQVDELLTGFWTLHGDVGDVSPIQLIPKTVEYGLAEILCQYLDDPAPLRAAMAAVPTDGLGISASDLDQLGVPSYAEVERLFYEYFTLRRDAARGALDASGAVRIQELEATGPVRRFLASAHKRRGPALLDPRA
ncbi:MAG: synthase, partial [Desulfomicrobiaceae bacterium]|nr:synthase [Desulfomicrobiaceae bacterium]